jgi:hypothetical protein
MLAIGRCARCLEPRCKEHLLGRTPQRAFISGEPLALDYAFREALQALPTPTCYWCGEKAALAAVDAASDKARRLPLPADQLMCIAAILLHWERYPNAALTMRLWGSQVASRTLEIMLSLIDRYPSFLPPLPGGVDGRKAYVFSTRPEGSSTIVSALTTDGALWEHWPHYTYKSPRTVKNPRVTWEWRMKAAAPHEMIHALQKLPSDLWRSILPAEYH